MLLERESSNILNFTWGRLEIYNSLLYWICPCWISQKASPFAVPRFARASNRQAFSRQVNKKTAKTVIKGCNLKLTLMLKFAWRNIPAQLYFLWSTVRTRILDSSGIQVMPRIPGRDSPSASILVLSLSGVFSVDNISFKEHDKSFENITPGLHAKWRNGLRTNLHCHDGDY